MTVWIQLTKSWMLYTTHVPPPSFKTFMLMPPTTFVTFVHKMLKMQMVSAINHVPPPNFKTLVHGRNQISPTLRLWCMEEFKSHQSFCFLCLEDAYIRRPSTSWRDTTNHKKTQANTCNSLVESFLRASICKSFKFLFFICISNLWEVNLLFVIFSLQTFVKILRESVPCEIRINLRECSSERNSCKGSSFGLKRQSLQRFSWYLKIKL